MKRIKLVDTTLEDWGATLKYEERRRKVFVGYAVLFTIVFGVLQIALYFLAGHVVLGLGTYTLAWLILGAPLLFWERKAVRQYLKSPQVGDVINFAFASLLGARLSVYDGTLIWFQQFVIIVLAYGTLKVLVLSLVKDRFKFLSARGTSYWYE